MNKVVKDMINLGVAPNVDTLADILREATLKNFHENIEFNVQFTS